MALTHRSQGGVIYIAGLVLTLGASTFNIMPLLTAGVVDNLGFSDGQAGAMSMAISLGSAASAFFAVTWVRSASWRRAAVVALGGMTAADLLALCLHGYWPFVLLQAGTGLFGTAAICLCLTILSDCPESARGFGLSNAMQVVYQISNFLRTASLQARGTQWSARAFGGARRRGSRGYATAAGSRHGRSD